MTTATSVSSTYPESGSLLPQSSLSANRLMSLDAYRGFVMLLMAAELLQFERLHDAFPGSPVWAFLAYHQSHVAWAGCSLHNLFSRRFRFWWAWPCPVQWQAGWHRGSRQWCGGATHSGGRRF